jgi:hypothetical protein
MIILRTAVLPRWLRGTGLVVSTIYPLNQGDILATAVPGFPVWDLAGLLGSTGWGLWVAALGVTVVLRRVRTPISARINAEVQLAGPPRSDPTDRFRLRS